MVRLGSFRWGTKSHDTCHWRQWTNYQSHTKLIKSQSKGVITKYRCVQEVPGICKCHINPQIDTVPCHNCIKHTPWQHFTCRFLPLIHRVILVIFILFVNSEISESMFYAWEMLRMDWPGNLMWEWTQRCCYAVFNWELFRA